MITIPAIFWERMLNEFEKNTRRVEQVAYLDGVILDDSEKCTGIVTTLTIPDATLERGRFEVSADAMSQAGKHFRLHRIARIAQIHTHPTEWVGHSPWDDQHAYSQVPGAISIVLPNYARQRRTLADAGVHLRNEDGWRELSVGEIGDRLRVIEGFLDFRKDSNEQQNILTPRRRPWWNPFAFFGNP
ncbi:MAG: hypothetical protein QM796_20355 [Chthoniobacteraceae bacterium]